jgi:hypothetical protein
MKYGNLTLGQVEALVNKVGGMSAVERILQGGNISDAIAKLLVEQSGVGETFTLDVNYDDPRWKSINRPQYSFVGNVEVSDYPVKKKGVKPVQYRELEFDQDPTTPEEILDRFRREGLRRVDRAEAETYLRSLKRERLGERPVIALAGPVVVRKGRRDVACVDANTLGMDLYWFWSDRLLSPPRRFLAACKVVQY